MFINAIVMSYLRTWDSGKGCETVKIINANAENLFVSEFLFPWSFALDLAQSHLSAEFQRREA